MIRRVIRRLRSTILFPHSCSKSLGRFCLGVKIGLATICLGLPTHVFGQSGPKPEDVKKFEDSNDLVGFAVVAYRVTSPTVGELDGCYKTYQAAAKKAAELQSLKVENQKIIARVEISWDFDGRSNVLTVTTGDKLGATKSTFFSQLNDVRSRLK